MKKILLTAVILIIAALCIGGVSAAPALGGDKGAIIVKSNAEGATVELLSINTDSLYTGTIKDGEAVFEVYSTATPINRAIVYCDGYKPAYCVIDGNPAKGDTKTYTVNLEEIPKTGAIGGDKGYFMIVMSEPGTKAELQDAKSNTLYEGNLDENGIIIFEVYTTATPIAYMIVYIDDPIFLPVLPLASGETEVQCFKIYNPTEPVETEPTPSPLGAATGLLGVLGACFLLRKN